MKLHFRLIVICVFAVCSLLQAGTIQYAVIPLGGNQYSYQYSLSGLTLAAGNEVDIRFDPALYGTLLGGTVGSDFDLVLLQPDNPPGVFGDYSASARIDNPSLAGPFSVDFVWLGAGTPGSQPFYINSYVTGRQQVLEQGFTTPAGPIGIPEPNTFSLAVGAILAGAIFCPSALGRFVKASQ